MNHAKAILTLIVALAFNNIYAGSPKTVQQFINHKNWNFVENKGQIPLSGKEAGGSNTEIKYYGYQGGVYLYCKPGMISFVFTRVKKGNDQNISEATGHPVETQCLRLNHASAMAPLSRDAFNASLQEKIITNRADLVLLNSNPSAQILASDRQEYYENYYTTGNADSGITNVHTYKTITYKDIYPHIDMVLHAREQGMKYEFVVYPGGKVSDIQMQWMGIEGIIRRDAYGKRLKNSKIEYSCALGKMEESAPYSYVGTDTRGCPYSAQSKIESQFILKNNRVGFKVDRYDKSKVLVIDPTLVWGTYFGGSSFDQSNAISTDESGNVYITGYTGSQSGIVTSGAFQTSIWGNEDAFLAKFSEYGKIEWATYYGGEKGAIGMSVATDALSDVYFTGFTDSNLGIATKGAYNTSNAGKQDAFLAKFNSFGILQWATFFGGNGNEEAESIASDRTENVYISGITSSKSNVATSGAFQTYFGIGADSSNAFLAKFNSIGKIQWATYFGEGNEEGRSIAVNDSSNIFMTGTSSSKLGIATKGAYQTSNNGGAGGGYGDAYLVRFDSSGNRIWATYYGGSQSDQGYGVALDKVGSIYMTGVTESASGIATKGAYQTSYMGGFEAFLAKFDHNGFLQWATYYGGKQDDVAQGVSTDNQNNVYFGGWTTTHLGLSTAGAYQTSFGGNKSAFLAKFNGDGTRNWATYYGGSNYDVLESVALSSAGEIFIAGITESSTGIATTGSYQTSYAGVQDCFLAMFNTRIRHDAGVSSITNPNGNTCGDSQIVKVVLHNYGMIALDSVTIGLAINGKPQNLYHWTGKLLPDSSISVALGKFLFGVGMDTLKAWTSNPNGFKDSVPENDTSTTIINVLPLPAAYTGPDKTICQYDRIPLGSNWESGRTYSWTSNSNPAIFPTSMIFVDPYITTTYYFTETINATGCSKTDSVVITVNPAPPANTGPAKTICRGDTINIGDTASNGFTFKWTSTPSGFSSMLPNPKISPSTTTTYTLVEKNTTTGCTNSNSVKITVNPLPSANTGQSSYSICTGTHIKIGANAKPGIAYLWTSNPAGFTSTLANPVVNPGNNTVYNLAVTDTATGCTNKNSADVVVSIAQAPVIDAGKNQTICAGASAQIGSNALSGDTYSWVSNPAGFTSTMAQLTITPKQTSSYSLTVTNITGCTNFDSVTIDVNPLPKTVAGKPQMICSGTPVSVGDTSSPGYVYSWTSPPAGFHSGLSNPVDSPTKSTIYHLKEVISATGCADSDSVLITVVPRPYVQFDVKNLNGFEYKFNAKNPNYPSWQYHWSFGDTSSTPSTSSGTDTADGYTVTHDYTTNGKYRVVLTVSLPGLCTEIDTYAVIINEQFSLNIFPNPFGLQTDINYTLVNPGHVKIYLTDEIGRQLGTLLDKQLTQGQYDTHFDAALWKTRPAMYFVIFQLDDKVNVKKMIQLDSIFY